MPRNTIPKRPRATIGQHIYEPIVIVKLWKKGLECREVLRMAILPHQSYHKVLANAKEFQERCGRLVGQGCYPVFSRRAHAVIVFKAQPKTERSILADKIEI